MRFFERLAQREENLMIDVAGKRRGFVRINVKAACQRRGKFPRPQESENDKPGLLGRKAGFLHRQSVLFADLKHFLRNLHAEDRILQCIRKFLVLLLKLFFGVYGHKIS